jgi:glycyl-tRNA synthetase beta chain
MTTQRHDFLVEIGTEELPPTALRGLEEAFAAGVLTGPDEASLEAQRGHH